MHPLVVNARELQGACIPRDYDVPQRHRVSAVRQWGARRERSPKERTMRFDDAIGRYFCNSNGRSMWVARMYTFVGTAG